MVACSSAAMPEIRVEWEANSLTTEPSSRGVLQSRMNINGKNNLEKIHC